ncbi:TPA: hypothetical protein DHW58_00080 [Patescibacteria group bacterium]|uniref:Zinc finger DksA/TraR C4-type domain-containing protein n=2 Tax=Bacteria division Kazan-3B-28 TaxID=1798534 RepID=A0A0G2A4C8_UNCK3|nr:MAG: transcriptional regulator, trar/dksa family, DnaK suppressor protein [candidate division Kazan bacterium GW2011_GWA1_50_15]KKW25897.1 MAG: hypothetical protein VE99_C0001G0536 [candidate division Kazan bacterium GW2011_GWC1_52_13]KKW27089.1 MAG: hypothetical protein VF00_C0001G0024 [candidate division Kazan bacterium GW2011_GWB1_52_7]HAV65912.1 hypothetical protein [Patescibacteria group bacterium]HCL47381.1 hypothetical protein [Patescibacteria group bacterium]
MHSRYSQAFLDEQQKILLQQKASLEEQLGQISRYDEASGTYIALQPDYDSGTVEDSADNSGESEVFQEREAQVSDLEKSLAEVTVALKKIDEGAYGRCETTGDWINEERLKVYPAARTCTEDHT